MGARLTAATPDGETSLEKVGTSGLTDGGVGWVECAPRLSASRHAK